MYKLYAVLDQSPETLTITLFDFIPGIYLASRHNVNSYNIAIAYLYNNNFEFSQTILW